MTFNFLTSFAKWGSLGLIVLVLLALVTVSCMDFDFAMKSSEARSFFQQRGLNETHHHYQAASRTIHYVHIGDSDKPLVIFIHGSPGSWDNFISFMANSSLLSCVQMISVDRPGFGESGAGIHEPSLTQQAADLKPILEKHGRAKNTILVGHSLGGPLVARMAMDYPDLVQHIVMVAPSIDPELEKTLWYQRVAEWRGIRSMIPKTLQVTNREILPLRTELEAMMPLWQDLNLPVTVIQGEKDKLVPPGNADFAERMLPHIPINMVRVDDLNHFVPWKRPDLIIDAIHHHLEQDPTK